MAGIKLGGLASGMDTDSVIAQLMQLEAQPANRLAQQKKVSESREQALKDILTRVKNLQTTANDLKSVATWADTQTVESSDAAKLGVQRTGGAGPGTYSVSVSQLASGDQWSYKYTQPAADTSFQITTAGGASQTVNLPAGSDIDTAVGIINSSSDSKVYAVNVNGRMVLSSRETGSPAAFSVTPVSATDALDQATQLRTAQPAKYSLDGGVTELTSQTNTVKNGIPGIDLTLKSVVPLASPLTVTVGNPAPDHAAIKDKITKFVEQYNSTLDFIRSKTSEEKVKDPKTDAERAKGVLRNDSMLNSIMQRMRNGVGAAFGTGNLAVNDLADIGIGGAKATGAASSADALAGKLTIDQDKLTAALTANPLSIRKLLGAADTDGGAQKFKEILDPLVADQGDFDQRVKADDTKQKRYQDQIDTLNKRLEMREKLLRGQFTAMETAISKSQSTSSWLAQQMR